MTNDLNLKVADFGFATKDDVNNLRSYTGSKMYMAPEIEECKMYDGFQVDMFSTGVILFILVTGREPFEEATYEDYFYNLLVKEKYDKFWRRKGGEAFSEDFKDLI